MRMTTKHCAVTLIAGVTLLWGSAGWANDAVNWLNQMQQAVRDLDYSGKLVYAQGKELSTFQIDHQRTNGKGSENIRLLETKGGVSGAASTAKSFSLVNFNRLQPQAQAYRYDLGGRETVAGRTCQVVVVRPKDKMRYLHRYCIDVDSRLLLKYSLMNRQQQQLEQLLFTEVSLASPTANNTAQSATQAQKVVAKAAVPPVHNSDKVAQVTHSKWQFTVLPYGFKHTQSIAATAQKPTDHLIVSDGMTAVSVFITPRSDQKTYREIKHSSGAVNILTQDLGPYLVTVIGEVPDSTLRAIHEGLRRVQ